LNQPRRVELDPQGGLSVLWTDGHRSVYAPRPLRLACRCAHCEDEWSGERRLAAASVPEDVRALEVRPVGRYGLQLSWSDGHGTGIYTFDRLRALCDCDTCRPTTAP
jgi:DUF971 family protein